MIEHSQPTLGDEEKRALIDVYKTTFISESNCTRKFEKHLSEFLNAKRVLCVPSGFVAIMMSVVALGGDRLKVFMPSFVCREVYDAIKMAGAEPVLCDIGEDFIISLSDIKKKLSRGNTGNKVLLLPHMFGLPANIDDYLGLNIPIIEDCAHTIGAAYNGQLTGTIGDVGILSFESTKMMTTGYGGAIVTNNERIMRKIEYLKLKVPITRGIRYSFYFTDIQSSIGIAQLQKLTGFIEKRKKIAGRYFREFKTLPIKLPKQHPGRDHIFYRFMIGSGKKKPKQIMELAYKKGFRIKQVVPALHRELGLNKKDFPMTERALNQWVSIPIYPSLKRNDISLIVSGVKEIFS